MRKRLGVVGVPSSAGAFAPGQEKAPAALRAAGLIERLGAAGIEVVDHGDREVWRWRPDRRSPRAQNVDAVVEIAVDTARRVREVVGAGEVALVLGGDCTVEIGTVAGHLSSEERIGLIYFDLHPDLNVPAAVREGALDWMGVAHLLGEDGAVEALSRVGTRFPLLDPADLLLFAYGPEQATPHEREAMERLGMDRVPVTEVASDPEGAAATAVARMAERCDRLLVHFDVDVIDFTDAPLSEETGRNQGLTLDQALRALRVLLGSEDLSAVTMTELNPDHGDEEGVTLDRLVTGLVAALAGSALLRGN